MASWIFFLFLVDNIENDMFVSNNIDVFNSDWFSSVKNKLIQQKKFSNPFFIINVSLFEKRH